MRIDWTERAEKQLDQIFNFIALDSESMLIERWNKLLRRRKTRAHFPEKAVWFLSISEMIYEKYFIILTGSFTLSKTKVSKS